jgi:3-methyl-2-oxobutanoate hydroxymethyltransferase
MDDAFTPKFVKRFAELGGAVREAVSGYVGEVKARTFPDAEHSFHSSGVRLVPVAPAQDDEEPPDAMGVPI